MLDTPVLFLVFNRPDTTWLVFEQIRQAKPRQLFVAADGPRPEKTGEKEKCEQVRELILRNVDWNCEVHTLFREENLGCGKAVSKGIDWFFEHVEEGIILEDDTIPHSSFFTYCSDLLNHYRCKEKIMHISGTNFQFGRRRGTGSYYFSKYFHIWGWATWKRSWQLYKFDLNEWNTSEFERVLHDTHKTREEIGYWNKIFNSVKSGQINTWDYQWLFSIWLNNGFCITPNVNLVSNVGAGAGATHVLSNLRLFNLPISSIDSVIHPKTIVVNEKADLFTYNKAINCKPTIVSKIRNKIASTIPDKLKTNLKYVYGLGQIHS